MMNVGTYFNRYRPGILFYWRQPAYWLQPAYWASLPVTEKTGCLTTAGTNIQIWLKPIFYSSGNQEC